MTCSTLLILTTMLLHTWFIEAAPVNTAELQKKAIITYRANADPLQLSPLGYNVRDFYFTDENTSVPVDYPHGISLLPDSWDGNPSIHPIDNSLDTRIDLASEIALKQLEILKKQQEELYNETADGFESSENDLDDIDFGNGYGSGDGFD